jgi:hypothetical protein
MRSSCAARDTRWSSPSDDSFATIIQLTFPYTSQGAFCGVCSADSNGTSYHRSVGRCEPCEGSILPAIASTVVALAVLLALLAVLRTSRGRKLLIKLHVSKRVNKYMDDQYKKGKAEVRENTSEMQFGLPDISLPSIFLTLTLKFPKVKWPELPPGQLYSLQLPQYDLPEFRLRYPRLQWPSVPNLAYVCNLVRIAFPDLRWPLLPDLGHLEWAWADWELPNVDATLPLATLRSRFPQLAWPDLPHVILPDLTLPRLPLLDFEQHFPQFAPWPKTFNLHFLSNLLRIGFPDLNWPNLLRVDLSLPDGSLPDLSLPKFELPDLKLTISFFDSLMVKLRILISMVQVLSQLGVVYSIPFPSLYSNLLRWIGLLELNFIDILPLGCVMTVGFHFSLLVRTLVLPALLLVALAAKAVRAPAKVADFFNGLNFLVLFLIYPSTSAAVFAAFQCEELSDGTRWLRADLSVDCDGDFHTLFRYYAGLMVIVYPLGTPLFYLFLLRRNRARLDKLRVNQALRIQLINNARASGDYKSGRASEDKRQVPWVISAEERSGLSVNVLKDLRELEHEDMTERAALPSSVSKLLKGYELRVCWFEIFECVRKLAVACLPVFFQPSGSASQLLFGLMVCFMCFGAYVHFDPFEDRGNDAVARLCQVQIFFSLLSSVALSFSDDENAGSYIDTLLVMLWFLPVTLAVVLESPLKSVLSALPSWLATKRMKTLPVGSGTTVEDPSTVHHGDINLASVELSTSEGL